MFKRIILVTSQSYDKVSHSTFRRLSRIKTEFIRKIHLCQAIQCSCEEVHIISSIKLSYTILVTKSNLYKFDINPLKTSIDKVE